MCSIKSVVCLLLLLLPAAVMGQSGQFLDLTAIPVGSSPNGVVIGDLNGDGIPDMAVANNIDSTVSIALGNGDGSFKPPTTIPVGTNPGSVAIADLNHDGKADLVVGTTTGILQVLLGNGDGTFGSPSTVVSPGAPVTSFPAVQVADFNGDGKLDIAVVVEYSNATTGVSILLGAGDGTFTISIANPGLRFPGMSQVQSLAVGDFDGNGTNDLAFTVAPSGSSGLVYILLNDGTGKFTTGTPIPLQGQPLGVTAGKFTGSGHQDLAVAVPPSSVAVLAGNGNGTFQAATYSTVGQLPTTVAATDLNGDGNEDIVTANFSSNTLSVLMGKGDGTFQATVNYPSLAGPFVLAIADVNHDGHPDVVVSNSTQNTVQVFLENSAGTLFTGSYPTGGDPIAIASGDFDGNGISDVATYNRADNSISIYLADGHGGFRLSQVPKACGANAVTSGTLVAGHFLSLLSDALVANCTNPPSSTSFTFLYSVDANGNAVAVQNSQGGELLSINVGDFNGDGFSDLFGAVAGVDAVFEDLRDIGFQTSIFFTPPGANFSSFVGDFNGDGRPDVVNGNSLGGCFVYLNPGGGSFSAGTPILCGATGVGDFNGDGLDDILVRDSDDTSEPFSTNISNGDGTFSPGQSVSPLINVVMGPVADFNGDGVPDVVVGTGTGVRISQGALDGSFADTGSNLAAEADVYSLLATSGDFDGNGSSDLAVVDEAKGFLDILFNKNSFSATATSLSVPANSSFSVGQPIALTAAVAGKTGVPTGSVVFKLSGTPTSTTALVNGAAQSTISGSAAAGQFAYTAIYTGDGTFSGSRSNRLVVTINQAHSTTTVTGTATPKLGVSTVYTATVTPQFSGTPTGTIQFFADGEPIGTGTLAGGQATVSYAATTMGAHKIEANYSGDTNFVTSLGVLSVKVSKAVATVSVAASANPAIYGTPDTLTATVTDSDGAVATGPVVFKEGTTIYGTVSLTSGAAQFVLPNLPIGTHKITAQYGGDTEDGTANGTISLVVQGEPTTTTITTSVPATNFGQSVTFTATVTATTGSPDGTLTFKNGSAVLGTVAVTSGQAQFTVSTLAAGTHTITALYNGGSAYAGSSGTLQQIVEKSATTTALTSSGSPATTGTSVTFTATVTSTEPEQVTGNVTFKDGKTSLGTVALVNGQAQLSTALLAKGAQTITASYAASTDYAASSTTLAQTMQ